MTETTDTAIGTAAEPETFTSEERAAMKERAKEKIGEMSGGDRAISERFHALVIAAAPHLTPKTWYGMPAYAKDGKIVCFFQPAEKFKARYATIGFNDAARLDTGTVWPTSFAVTELAAADEEFFADLVRRAAG
ncbi:uncharacterized protein YdhG (YjbR/CyaY superfamily) [Diaminobutyricimonas aerilata]|uniref:Uncharacterized protein YdhG (YjbR/CyaY superfamily) n=1 Tax=Diaminobutyricimonas aerilata TaxID=1162967 RepID=A0A2M9CFK2_9MICO|nr:DUF1801 domain-containing protein [Diaminobutyricimonas aerilata]PJJ70648.1 uncharacterized protein YdhG (YjbR/CyaY superfamily) [Diaminobutyricimonas aerilata]